MKAVFKKFIEHFEAESDEIEDETLDEELKMVETIINSRCVPDFYYEPQAKSDTCFIHATNMYFQREYVTKENVITYDKLVSKYAKEITEIIKANSKSAFYGDIDVPLEKDTSEVSVPSKNTDLKGYYDIYNITDPKEFSSSLTKKFKELSPQQVMFLLEFQYHVNKDTGSTELHYVPHRFYHRYARGQDQETSRKTFVDIAKKVATKQVYFNHIESGKAHAFAAAHVAEENNDYWVLLDSLWKRKVLQPDTEKFFSTKDHAGRASVMMIEDDSRKPSIIGAL
mmetsp:Transcript_30211/g.33764  ORF Transcript_30211/g.33764 Transcript_30211/m.33764 type:complete len:283 (+) Transcript_30211:41-889(+)